MITGVLVEPCVVDALDELDLAVDFHFRVDGANASLECAFVDGESSCRIHLGEVIEVQLCGRLHAARQSVAARSGRYEVPIVARSSISRVSHRRLPLPGRHPAFGNQRSTD